MDVGQVTRTSGSEIPRSIKDYRTIIRTGMAPKVTTREIETRRITTELGEILRWEMMEIVVPQARIRHLAVEIWTGIQETAICREATLRETQIGGRIEITDNGVRKENSNDTASQVEGPNNQVLIGPWTRGRFQIMTQGDVGSKDDMTITGSRSTSGQSNSAAIRRSCQSKSL